MSGQDRIQRLIEAIARHLTLECKGCRGLGCVTIGCGSEKVIDGVRYAGEMLQGECPSCGPIRKALAGDG